MPPEVAPTETHASPHSEPREAPLHAADTSAGPMHGGSAAMDAPATTAAEYGEGGQGAEDGAESAGNAGAVGAEPAPEPSQPEDASAALSTSGASAPDHPSTSAAAGSAGGGKQRGRGRGLPVLQLLLVGIALPAAAALLRRLRRGRSEGQQQPTSTTRPRGGASTKTSAKAAAAAPPVVQDIPPPDSMPVLLPVSAVLSPPPAPPAPLPPHPLASLTFVASEDIDVAGAPTTHGVPAWRATPPPPAPASAPAVVRLLSAGATLVGKSSIQPVPLLGNGVGSHAADGAATSALLVGASVGNPLNRARVAGGGATGAAVAVATGLADLALAADVAGEGRVPAACCGLFAVRPSPGVLGPATCTPAPAAAASAVDGAPLSGASDGTQPAAPQAPLGAQCLTLMARDAGTLMKAGEALRLPGSANLRGEILKFVVAQDLFELCAPELQPATVAVKKAILKWAGAEQAGAVQLVRFLSSNTDAWQGMEEAEGIASPGTGAGAGEAGDVRLSPFVEAAIAAVRVLAAEEAYRGLSREEREQLESSAAAAAAAAALVSVDGEQQEEQGVSKEEGEPAAAAAQPPQPPSPRPSPAALASALSLMRQVSDVLRATVKPDTIMVLPGLPFPPPRRAPPSSPSIPGPNAAELAAEHAVFSKLLRCFHAFATLGGCPSVCCPVGRLRDGSPVSVSLFGVQRFDMRLLAVGAKLTPMIQEAFTSIKEEITNAARAQEQQEAAAAAGQQQPASQGGKPGAAGALNGSSDSAPSSSVAAADPKRVAKAERFKAKGNEHYAAGRHADAVSEYTKAINTHPNNPVYYNNRAMACIKLFRFEQAEEDCCRALKFPDLSDKDRVKALLRRATARDALQRYDDAERDFKEVLRLEPGNRQAREELAQLRKHRAEMEGAQAAMINQLRQQQAAAAAAGGGGLGAGRAAAAAAAAGGMLPPGFDPSLLPPGFDPASMLPPGFDPALLGLDGGGAGGQYGYALPNGYPGGY